MTGAGTVPGPLDRTVGVVGGGQLARMLAIAGHQAGVRTVVLESSAGAPAAAVADLIEATYDDPAALDELAARSDVVTYELEGVPLAAAERLEAATILRPGTRSLAVTQDRLAEKRTLSELGIPVAPFEPVDDEAGFRDALGRVGAPAVLKTRRLGYDGRGQEVVRSQADAGPVWAELGGPDRLLEGFVSFRRELSVVAVRNAAGDVRCYPVVENRHVDGILNVTIAPAPDLAPEVERLAVERTRTLLDALDHVGVMTLELFEVDGDVLANEIAPRVHNSGHWTIEGAETSQFENHLRAVLDLPLGSTALRAPSAMVNVIGRPPAPGPVLEVAGAALHLYGKSPRPARKLGHVTVTAPDVAARDERLTRLLELITPH